MPALDAAAVVLILALPLIWVVRRELANLADPAYLREQGVVIVSEDVLQDHSAPIGEYLGRPIWGSVTFKGMEYRFHRLQDRRKREQLAPRELFLEPGLVYRTV
jgi:hypothetical protein